MKKLILILLCCIPFTIKCSAELIEQENQCLLEEKSAVDKSFFYWSVGAGSHSNIKFIPLPGIGLGYRYQHNYIGFDISADAGILPALGSLMFKLSPALLVYPYPDDTSEYYCGLSCGICFFYQPHVYRSGSNNTIGLLPELVAGYQFQTDSGREYFVEFRPGLSLILDRDNHHDFGMLNDFYKRKDKKKNLYPTAGIRFGLSF